jgi:predicted nuclease with RNAse H fold
MRTVGVDLSAEPKKTAVAVVEWSRGEARISAVEVNQTDDDIAAACEHAHKVGIDCPLGWPEPFIDFVTAHRDRAPLAAHDLAGRQDLAYRMTDLVLIEDKTGKPLSASTDRIGRAAMRAAGLLAALSRDHDVDRAGSGLVVEVYPAAALKHWGLTHRKYKEKKGTEERKKLLKELRGSLPALTFARAEDKAICQDSDDALDAVVCAVIARAVALGEATTPTHDQAERAKTEGWIAVPTGNLADLDR